MRRLVVIFALVATAAVAAAQQAPAPTPRRPAAPAPARGRATAPPAPVDTQPRVVALAVEKCLDCTATVKKRLAVVSVNVDSISPDFGKPATAVASSLRDALEGELAGAAGLLLVNRTQFADVISEQQLATSGVANRELAPQQRAIIPAQLLLYATATRLDLGREVQRNESTSAQAERSKADRLDQQAAEFEQQFRSRMSQSGRNDCRYEESRLELCQTLEANAEAARARGARVFSLGCGLQEANLQRCEDNLDRQDRENEMAAAASERQQRELRNQANALRARAREEETRNISTTTTKTASLSMTWRAIDTATGVVLASGVISRSARATETSEEQRSTFGVDARGNPLSTTNSTSSLSRDENLLNDVIGMVMPALRADVESKTKGVAFKVRIVKVDTTGVILNVGSEQGLSVGDTFGVRQKSEDLTDPVTGQILSAPGPLIGLIRVSQVSEKIGTGQVLQGAGTLRRGDELEWVGVYRAQ